MVSFVSVTASNHTNIVLGFDTKANFELAQEIAAQINAAVAAGTVVTEFDTDGLPTLPGSVSGAVVQTANPLIVLPAGYTIDIVTKPGPATVIDPNGDPTVLAGVGTSLTFIAASGSGTVDAGGYNNRIDVSGSGNWLLYTAGPSNIIDALGGVNATISAGFGHNGIFLGSGTDLISSTGDDTVVGGTGSETINATGTKSDFVEGNASSLLFIGGSGGATIFGGSGSDTYLGSAGSTGPQLIEGGKGGNNFLQAGDGLATLIGGGNNDQLYAFGSANQLLIAGSGNETLSAAASSGSDTLKAGSGNDQLSGGGGSDTFVGGSGAATVTTGYAGQVFEFIKGYAGGSELVQGIYDPTQISIDLVGYGANEVTNALSTQVDTSTSVTIGLSDGTKITFQNVTSLSSSNFT